MVTFCSGLLPPSFCWCGGGGVVLVCFFVVVVFGLFVFVFYWSESQLSQQEEM